MACAYMRPEWRERRMAGRSSPSQFDYAVHYACQRSRCRPHSEPSLSHPTMRQFTCHTVLRRSSNFLQALQDWRARLKQRSRAFVSSSAPQ